MKHTFRYLTQGVPVPGEEVTLSSADSHHLARVIRRREGDEIELIDGTGRLWPAVVVAEGPPAVVRVSAPRLGPTPAPVTLYQGLAEWGRLDVLVEKAAELGLERVVLFRSERVRRAPDPDAWRRRRGRFLRVAEAAARQAGHGQLPRIEGLMSFEEVLEEVGEGEGHLLDPRGAVALADVLGGAPGRVALVIGPEAGFSDAEVARAEAAGLPACSLGPAVLRAETAALVALSLALASVGALSQTPPRHEALA
jgi:16S rRNA (uracil1498-N3)-methyltransferase